MAKARSPRTGKRQQPAVEWQTLLLAGVIYAGFGLLTWYANVLPWWLLLPTGAWLVAWHGSLQHEATHRHPTRWNTLNELIVLPCLWLWLPFRVYKSTHLAHHRDRYLTDPLQDPESWYKTRVQWQHAGSWQKLLWRVNNTLAGRFLVGPLISAYGTWRSELPRLLYGDRESLATWGMHAIGVALVLIWVLAVCHMTLLDYVLLFAYPGTSLSLLRSFAEHRAVPAPTQRTVIVEAAWPWALLFLNNNLHALHHRQPSAPWYALPRIYRANRDTVLEANGGYRFKGYGEILWHYLFRAKEPIVHPAIGQTEDIAANTAPGNRQTASRKVA